MWSTLASLIKGAAWPVILLAGAGLVIWFMLHQSHIIDQQKTRMDDMQKLVDETKKWNDALSAEYVAAAERQKKTETVRKVIRDAPKTGCGAVSPALGGVLDGLR